MMTCECHPRRWSDCDGRDGHPLLSPPPYQLLPMPPVTAATAPCRLTATTGSGSNGPIFDPITMPQSRGGGSGDYGNSAAASSHYISILLKICHKLLYAKFVILEWCRYHMKN